MNATILNRTILAAVIGSVLGFGLGAPSGALAQDLATQDQQASEDEQTEKERRRKAREEREAGRAQAAEANRANAEANRAAAEENRGRAQAEARQRENEQRQAAQAERNSEEARGSRRDARQQEYRQQQAQLAAQADRNVAQAREQSERQAREQQERSRDRQERYTPVPPVRQDADDTARNHDGRRRGDWGNDSDRRRRIDEQRSQAERYQRAQQVAQDRARRNAINLQNQRRSSQYRYHQDYYSRLRQYNQRHDWQRYDYNNDPYFHTAPSYRYQRDGRYYNVNRYAADMLQQAVNYGYGEGIRAGRADRYDGWRYSYRDSFAYMDANYGYRGMYVSQFDYNYYFRQGFRRGYEDGYYGRRRYGRQNNGSDALLGTVLSLIINLQPYRY